jgi:hypothetical protein
VRYACRRNDYAEVRNANPSEQPPRRRTFNRSIDGSRRAREKPQYRAFMDDASGISEFTIAFAHHEPSIATLSTVPLRM